MSLSTVKKPNHLVEKGVPESAGLPSQTTEVLYGNFWSKLFQPMAYCILGPYIDCLRLTQLKMEMDQNYEMRKKYPREKCARS